MHQYQDLITIFNDCFAIKYNTQLLKGEEEPLYLPADASRPYHAIFFAHGYFSSALHECAHWFIAGEERRKKVDFGYWYAPDGRTPEQQTLFESLEVKPQALEWLLSRAAGHPFRVSLDNLNGVPTDTRAFKLEIVQQTKKYCVQGLPRRAEIFRRALCYFYGTPLELKISDYDIETLL